MRILLVHNAYGKRSGEEVVVDQQHLLLQKNGHETARFERTSAGLRDSVSLRGRAFFAPMGSKRQEAEIRAAIEGFGPNLIHIHNLYPWISPAVLPVCKEMGVPIVMTVHNYRLLCPSGLMFSHGEVCERCVDHGELSCVQRNCEGSIAKSAGYALRNFVARKRRWYLDNVDCFAVLTHFQQLKLIGAGVAPERIAQLPNMAEVADCPRAPSDSLCVGFIGRVSAEKGVAVLLDAMRQCDVPCLIAGAYDAQPDLPSKAPENVKFLGMLEKDQLKALYGGLRCVVAPSIWYEGFPMAIVEAMAAGLPVVASRIGGIPEIVEHGVTGLLFEPGNAEDLANNLRRLLDNPELADQMGKAGREKVAREYSEERYYERLMSIYKKVMA